jgi:outer membrane protein assembly factor BamB
MRGARTNILGTNLDKLNMELSNPFEHYWTHVDAKGVGGTGADDLLNEEKALLTYNAGLNAPYRTNASKTGFPRPYAWWEALWTENVRGASSTEPHSLNGQGWDDMGASDTSMDLDVEGETAGMCSECLYRQGLMLLPMNHDLDNNREDLRLHGINATKGIHVWDYHLPASLDGDDADTTPAIANNLVFVAYQMYGKTATSNREARLLILDADDGTRQQDMPIYDDSDAVILPPTIANGAVYVATYDFNGTYGSGNTADDVIRLFSMSPVIRLVSTGVYPFDYPGAEYPLGYRHYTGGATSFAKITSLDHDAIFKNPSGDVRGVWKRKLQVWVTGQDSKWEEVREILEE